MGEGAERKFMQSEHQIELRKSNLSQAPMMIESKEDLKSKVFLLKNNIVVVMGRW